MTSILDTALAWSLTGIWLQHLIHLKEHHVGHVVDEANHRWCPRLLASASDVPWDVDHSALDKVQKLWPSLPIPKF